MQQRLAQVACDVYDERYDERYEAGLSSHNYFFLKGLAWERNVTFLWVPKH